MTSFFPFLFSFAFAGYNWGDYCAELQQSEYCLYRCEVREEYYGDCDSDHWCRCGYCEKVWSQALATCTYVWYSNGGDCGDGECCDFSSATCEDCGDCDYSGVSTSSSLSEDSPLYTSPAQWEGWTRPADSLATAQSLATDPSSTSATQPQKSASKAPGTVLVLSLVGLIGAAGAAGLYWTKRKQAAQTSHVVLESRMAEQVTGVYGSHATSPTVVQHYVQHNDDAPEPEYCANSDLRL